MVQIVKRRIDKAGGTFPKRQSKTSGYCRAQFTPRGRSVAETIQNGGGKDMQNMRCAGQIRIGHDRFVFRQVFKNERTGRQMPRDIVTHLRPC